MENKLVKAEETLKGLNLTELSTEEQQEVNGGIVPLILIGIGVALLARRCQVEGTFRIEGDFQYK